MKLENTMSEPIPDIYNLSDDELLALDTAPVQDTAEEVQADDSGEPQETEQDTSEEAISEEDSQAPEYELPNQDKEIDYEAFYQKMTTPFKANGREIKIDDPDDAIRLMQQGVNYSKRMEELKPKRALLKVLEERGLADKDKLGYLIDLANKEPKAIAKLLKESDIDLYEFDTSQADEYQPNLEVNEPTLFEDTLTEVTSNYPEMNEVLPQIGQWDTESKNALFSEPSILRVLAEQKRTGFYDKVVNIVEQERILGRLDNMPFLQAYSAVESALIKQNNNPQSSNQSNHSFVDTRPTASDNNTDKKKKAGTPNSNPASNTNTINMLAISDEELLNLNL